MASFCRLKSAWCFTHLIKGNTNSYMNSYVMQMYAKKQRCRVNYRKSKYIHSSIYDTTTYSIIRLHTLPIIKKMIKTHTPNTWQQARDSSQFPNNTFKHRFIFLGQTLARLDPNPHVQVFIQFTCLQIDKWYN